MLVGTLSEQNLTPLLMNPRFVDRSLNQFITLMNHLSLRYPQKMKQAVSANEYCGDYIPQVVGEASSDAEPAKLESMISVNTEIYNSYFAVCFCPKPPKTSNNSYDGLRGKNSLGYSAHSKDFLRNAQVI